MSGSEYSLTLPLNARTLLGIVFAVGESHAASGKAENILVLIPPRQFRIGATATSRLRDACCPIDALNEHLDSCAKHIFETHIAHIFNDGVLCHFLGFGYIGANSTAHCQQFLETACKDRGLGVFSCMNKSCTLSVNDRILVVSPK